MKHLMHQVCDELEMAKGYIECASKVEGDDRDVYKSIARDELNHAEKLIVLGDSHVASLPETDKCRIIWEFKREEFKTKQLQLKAEHSML